MKESDIYLPIKKFFEELGYIVQAEVKDADVTAIKGDELVIVEMKTTISLKLLYQATHRLRLTDNVYVAIPKPNYKKYRSKSFKEKMYLVKRLHLGLMLVDTKVKIEFDPKPFNIKSSQSKSKKKKLIHLKEFSNRGSNINIGGVTGKKIMTVYREQALLIASTMLESKKTIKEIRTEYAFDKLSSILQKNYYNWFIRVERGTYKLSELGLKEINDQKQLIELLSKKKSS